MAESRQLEIALAQRTGTCDITCRIPITRNSTIPVECKGWETGGRVHLVGTIIGRITGAYLTRYPNARTGRVAPPSSKQERTRASI